MPIPDQLDRFCDSHYPRVVASLTVVCGNRALAEELAQDAFERLARDWWKVSRMSSPEGWLHTVAINFSHSYFRRKAAERRALARTDTPSDVITVSHVDDGLDIRAAIARLPRGNRPRLC